MTEQQICKSLGVTHAGLRLLARAIVNDGEAAGRGFGHGSSGARARLLRDGFVERTICRRDGWDYTSYVITESGRAKVAEARRLGW